MKDIIPALVTPFDRNQNVDYGALRELTEMLVQQGVGGFYACGSTAECFLLSDEERRKVAETVLETVNGRVGVTVHVGAISTAKTVELAKHAASAGASAVSSVPPFYYKFSMDEIARYYAAISQAVELPVIVYSIPCFSGVALTAENLGTIMENCRVGGLKYTDYDLYTLDKISRRYPELPLYCGHDEVLLNALPIGLRGAIGSTFNVMAPMFRKILALYRGNKIEEAARLQKRANAIIDVLIEAGCTPAVKYLLSKQGLPCGVSRDPFAPLSPQTRAKLDALDLRV